MLIDNNVEGSSKVLAVTNKINWYGKVPGTVWTRLSAFAKAGTNKIEVLEATDWKKGDSIVIGPSGMNPDQDEQFTITDISGTTLTLNGNLKHNHFGDKEITVVE